MQGRLGLEALQLDANHLVFDEIVRTFCGGALKQLSSNLSILVQKTLFADIEIRLATLAAFD